MFSNSRAGPFFSSTRRATAPISRSQSTSAVIRRSSPSLSSTRIHCRRSMKLMPVLPHSVPPWPAMIHCAATMERPEAPARVPALLFVLLVVAFFDDPYRPSFGLDPSWGMALGHFLREGLQLGPDVV